VWGDVLPDLAAADVRIINLENALTTSDDWAKVSASSMAATTHEPF
jgi:thymidine phosphorylase